MSAKHPGAPRALLAALIATSFLGALAFVGCGTSTVVPKLERGTPSGQNPDGGPDAGPDGGAPDGGLPDAGPDAGPIDPLACAQQQLQAAVDSSATLSGDATPTCGGSSWNLCCPGGTATSPCGPVDFALALQAGDSPRLVVAADAGSLDVTLRARASATGVPIERNSSDCTASIDSTQGTTPDFTISFTLLESPDGGLTWAAPTVTNVETTDYSVSGSGLCALNVGSSTTLSAGVTSAADDAVHTLLCASCPCN